MILILSVYLKHVETNNGVNKEIKLELVSNKNFEEMKEKIKNLLNPVARSIQTSKD